MKQPTNSLQLPKPTADTHKIQIKLMTVGLAKKHLQIKTALFIIREVNSDILLNIYRTNAGKTEKKIFYTH